MMRTLAQTGNGWMTFKDAANRTANQTAEPGHVVHSSNLCTEILEVTDDGETAVCNLGSVNLGAFVDPATRRHRLGAAGRDRPHGRHLPRPGRRHQLLPDRAGGPFQRQVAAGRPRRDGSPGRLLQAAAALRLARGARRCPPGSPSAIMLAAYEASADLAERNGPLPAWEKTRTAQGVLHPDHYGVELTWPERWAALRDPDRLDRHAQLAAPRHRARPPPSRRSRASTSASSRRSPTCSSARRCPASSSRSTPTWWRS